MGGVFFPLREGIFCVQKMRRNDHSRDSTAFAYHERLPSAKLGWVETGGTHQSRPGTEGVRLRQSRHHCGRDRRVFVSNRQVDEASAETREFKLGAALPYLWRARGGQRAYMSMLREFVPTTPLK